MNSLTLLSKVHTFHKAELYLLLNHKFDYISNLPHHIAIFYETHFGMLRTPGGLETCLSVLYGAECERFSSLVNPHTLKFFFENKEIIQKFSVNLTKQYKCWNN